MPHPFNLLGREGQAARDKAAPMVPRVGEQVMQRCGDIFEIESGEHCRRWALSGGRHLSSRSQLDIIAAVDAERRVIRTAEGEVMPDLTPSAPELHELCRHAAAQAGFAIANMLQAHDRRDVTNGEVPELLADALRSALLAADPDCASEAGRQLLDALERYLDGWGG